MQYTLHERDVRMEGYNSGVAYGMAQGMEKGVAQGFSQGDDARAIKDATNFLLHNTPVKLISECIGLSMEEVEALAARLKREGKLNHDVP